MNSHINYFIESQFSCVYLDIIFKNLWTKIGIRWVVLNLMEILGLTMINKMKKRLKNH